MVKTSFDFCVAVSESEGMQPPSGAGCTLLIGPGKGGERLLIDISAHAADAIEASPPHGPITGLDPTEAEALLGLGALRPCRWAEQLG